MKLAHNDNCSCCSEARLLISDLELINRELMDSIQSAHAAHARRIADLDIHLDNEEALYYEALDLRAKVKRLEAQLASCTCIVR